MKRLLLILSILVLIGALLPSHLQAAESAPDSVVLVKGRVERVLNQTERLILGTDTTEIVQTLQVRILEGSTAGAEVVVENDYLVLEVGQVAYFRHTTNELLGTDVYTVSDPYRIPALAVIAAIFLAVLCVFGGWQGLRGLLALAISFFLIAYVLLPGILAGHSPVLVSMGVASLIVVLGSYITHGFNRTTTAAVVGMVVTIICTGLLALWAISAAHLTGYSSEEATYLNFGTGGTIDFVGLLLGSIMIGLLGVMYDAAIGQAVAVEELYRAGNLGQRAVFGRALRIGREHIGALVNTLAIAYVGASLPLLLLVQVASSAGPLVTLNQELFASEVIRTVVGSIGVVLVVPITTAIAVLVLTHMKGKSAGDQHAHRH